MDRIRWKEYLRQDPNHFAWVAKQQDDGDLGKIMLYPFQEKLCAYVLNYPFARKNSSSVFIDPFMLYLSIENCRRWFYEFVTTIIAS